MTTEASVTGTQKKKPGPQPGSRIKKVEFEVLLVGRDKKPIRPEEVFRLAAIGCKDNEICNWFGIDENTLTYNFKAELLTGRESLKQSLRRKQIEVALAGNPTMLIWLGKQLLSQQETPTDADASILPWNTEAKE